MAKAADHFSTGMLLRDARAMVTETCQASGLAERLLLRRLTTGEVRWRCLGMEGWKHDSDPGNGDPEFWRDTAAGSGPGPRISVLRVNWSESSARRGGMMGYTAYRIELAKEDVAKLLPVVETEAEPNSRTSTESNSPTTVSETKTATKKWVTDEARRMKAADEIPTGIKITPFAQQLAGRMAAAACNDPSIRPVTWRYIKNELPSWGLWPISKIKI